MDPISSSLMLFSATVSHGKKQLLRGKAWSQLKGQRSYRKIGKAKGKFRVLLSFGWGWNEGRPMWGHARHQDTHKRNRKGRKKNGLVQSPNQVTCWFSPVMCSPDLQAMSTSFSKSVWKTENREDGVKRGWWRAGKLGKCKISTLLVRWAQPLPAEWRGEVGLGFSNMENTPHFSTCWLLNFTTDKAGTLIFSCSSTHPFTHFWAED